MGERKLLFLNLRPPWNGWRVSQSALPGNVLQVMGFFKQCGNAKFHIKISMTVCPSIKLVGAGYTKCPKPADDPLLSSSAFLGGRKRNPSGFGWIGLHFMPWPLVCVRPPVSFPSFDNFSVEWQGRGRGHVRCSPINRLNRPTDALAAAFSVGIFPRNPPSACEQKHKHLASLPPQPIHPSAFHSSRGKTVSSFWALAWDCIHACL